MTLIKKNISFLIITTVILITSIFLITSNSLADNSITFEKAVEIGLENNSEINDLKNNLSSLKRNEEMVYAQKDWNLNLSGNYSHDFEEDEKSIPDENFGQSGGNDLDNSVTLKGSKNYNFGLSLNPSLTVSKDDESLSLNITQKLYPIQESEYEKNLYDNQKEIMKTKENLNNLKANKIITWTQSFLNIVRMEENKEIYLENLEKAEQNLEKIKKEKEIGEAGEQQLLTAQISVENANYDLKEQNFKIEENKIDFKNRLGIDKDRKIIFDSDSKMISELENKTDKLLNKYLGDDNLMEIVEENNVDLIINKLEQEALRKDLEELKKEDKISVDLSSSYNTTSEDLTATLNFNYNLYDGGQHELNIENKKENITNKIEKYDQLYKELELELEKNLNTIVLNKDKLENQKLNLEKSKNDLEIAKMKYENGVIDYLSYQESWIATKEKEISIKSLKDSNFINNLNFINFINNENVIGGF